MSTHERSSIYSVDNTFWVIKIMDCTCNRTEHICYMTIFLHASSHKMQLFIHSTTSYIHPRLDSGNEPKFSDCITYRHIDIPVPLYLHPSVLNKETTPSLHDYY